MTSPVVVPLINGSGAASAANFEALAKSIARWLNRTDLAEVIPDFIRMAESEFARDPRIRGSFQTTITNGYTPDGEFVLPVDMLELTEMRFEGQVVKQMPREAWNGIVQGTFYARVGNVATITGKPAGAYQLTYVQKLPSLVFPSDSNWLLREHYDVYLWKCCEQGSVWMRDAEAAQGYSTKYERAVAQLLEANNLRAWGGASVQILAPGVV